MKLSENREMWIKRVEEFQSSELTQTSWCKANNVNGSALRYWIRTLSDSDKSNKVLLSDGNNEFEWANVIIPKASIAPGIVLEVNGVKITIDSDFEENLLLKTVKALKSL